MANILSKSEIYCYLLHFLQALAGLVEMPAIAIAMYIIGRVGKKWLFCATLFSTGLACLCAAISEGNEDILWLKITFVMIGKTQFHLLIVRSHNSQVTETRLIIFYGIVGKFTISAGNTIMPVYTAELYPTAIRNAGVGACNVAAGLALILTPYLEMLVSSFLILL